VENKVRVLYYDNTFKKKANGQGNAIESHKDRDHMNDNEIVPTKARYIKHLPRRVHVRLFLNQGFSCSPDEAECNGTTPSRTELFGCSCEKAYLTRR
jgi:hypothetical protein